MVFSIGIVLLNLQTRQHKKGSSYKPAFQFSGARVNFAVWLRPTCVAIISILKAKVIANFQDWSENLRVVHVWGLYWSVLLPSTATKLDISVLVIPLSGLDDCL